MGRKLELNTALASRDEHLIIEQARIVYQRWELLLHTHRGATAAHIARSGQELANVHHSERLLPRRKRRRFKIKLLCNGNATDHMVARRRRGHQRLEPLIGIFSKLFGNMHAQLTVAFDIDLVRINGISDARTLKLAHRVGLLDLFFLRHVLAPDIKQPQSTTRGALGSIASCKRALSRWGRRPQNLYSQNRRYT